MLAHGPTQAAEDAEYAQAMNVAQAAAATKTLEHCIWSILPSAAAVSEGKHHVSHFENKARADDYICEHLPALAKKMTFLWVAYYPWNILRAKKSPTLHDTSEKYIWLSPVRADTVIRMSGAQARNTGVFVHAILEKPDPTLPAKYAMMNRASR